MSNLVNIFFGKGSFKNQVDNTVPVNTGVTIAQTEKGRVASIPSGARLNGYGVISGVKTIVLIIKPTGNVDILLDDGDAKLSIVDGDISGAGLTECYVNTVNTYAISFDVWSIVIAEFSGGIDFVTDFEIDPTIGIFLARIVCDSAIFTGDQISNFYTIFQKLSSFSVDVVTNRGESSEAIVNVSGVNWNADGVTKTAGQTIGDFFIQSGSFAYYENGEKGSENEVLGDDLVVNGDFSQPLIGTWLINGTPDIYNYVIIEDEKCKIVSNGTLIGIYQSLDVSKGKTYKISFDIDILLLGWRFQIVENGYISNRADQGNLEFYYTSVSNTFTFSFIRSTLGPSQFTVDNVSVKEVLSPNSKTITCLSSGNLSIKGVREFEEWIGNGTIRRIDGDLSANAGLTVDASALSYTDGVLTITMTAGQVIQNLTIAKDAG